MTPFAQLTAKLNMDIQGFATNMRRASTMASRFSANMQGQINAGMVDPVKKAKFEFKDVARIVQGILISKAFYSGLNAIRQATGAVWEFSKSLEYAKMVYTTLFKSESLAVEFLNVLQDFAAVTPFTFKQSEDAAKRLLAYGIQYKNVMYVMQGVLAAATVQGNDSIIEPISRAIGQIYTKGRLMNEEMRQLAEAGIPVYEILQEKLGLTAKELRNLGRTAVPASTAINALIDGINERFSTTLQYASMTTQGIISNIKDNSVMLFSTMLEPMSESFKESLSRLGSFIFQLRSLNEIGGVGAVFENLVPKDLRYDIKVLIVNFKMLGDIIKTNLSSAFRIFIDLSVGMLRVINALSPVLLSVMGAISAVLRLLTSNETLLKIVTALILAAAAAWAVFRVQALASAVTVGVIKLIAGAVKGLVLVLNVLVAHPVWTLLALGVGIFVALASSSEKFRNSINNLTSGFRNLSGMNTDNILLPDSKKRASDLSKFNQALDTTSKGMDNLADSTGSAAKAAKGLLGFDEIFSLKTPDESGAGGIEDVLSGLGNIDFSGLDFNMPSVDELASTFITNFVDALGGKESLLSAGIGTLIGGAIGGLIGGPAGIKIGAAIGAFAGWFWPKLADMLKLSDFATIGLPIATSIGGAIGFMVGGPGGALIGAAIGGFVTWLADAFAKGIDKGDWSDFTKLLGAGLGAAIGFIVGGPVGAAVGVSIGTLVGWLVDSVVTAVKTGDWSKVAVPVGIGLGAAIGMLIGGPPGAIIGAAIGDVAGSIVSQYWDKIAEEFKKPTTAGVTIGMLIGGLIGTIFGPAGIFVGTAIGGAAGGIVGKYWANIKEWLSKPPSLGPIIGMLLGALLGSIFGPVGTLAGAAIGAAAGGIVETYWKKIKSKITVADAESFKISTALGSVLGNVLGPAGGLIGSIIGGAASKVVQKYWEDLKKAFSKLDFSFFSSPSSKVTGGSYYGIGGTTIGHATGGIFNKEHLARFAEGNKPEAIIPLDNNSAMQPFVDAVSNGLLSTLMPMMTSGGQDQGQLRPLYVGTLIADERSLKELSRRMHVIQLEEDARRG